MKMMPRLPFPAPSRLLLSKPVIAAIDGDLQALGVVTILVLRSELVVLFGERDDPDGPRNRRSGDFGGMGRGGSRGNGHET